MKVKITKCSYHEFWYADKIGEVFEVYHDDEHDYALISNSTYLIGKQDCEVIEEPTQIIDVNGIQTEPFTHEQKKVIAVEKDLYKAMLWQDMLTSFKTADELQRIALLEIFEEMGYPQTDMVKLFRTFQNEL